MRLFWTVVAIMGVILGGVAVTQAQDAGSLSGRIAYAAPPPPKKKPSFIGDVLDSNTPTQLPTAFLP